MITASTTRITPTVEQINPCRQAIDAYIQSIQQNPKRREGAYPYYLFHEPGHPIRGTVLLFHGFSARPHQMWRLANYLYQNDFNVYQPSIAGHMFLPPATEWPQVDLRPEYEDPLREKVKQDPVLLNFFANLGANPNSPPPNQQQSHALLARLMRLDPSVKDILQAIESNNEEAFDRYFISSHLQYRDHASDRLTELDAMPGPIYAVGLSVGGAVALGVAAANPGRISRIVAYAPLLKIYGEDRRQYVNLSGPLDISESGWDPNLCFPVGALTAADRFGSACVLSPESIRTLQQVPTFLALTENEDAADIATNQDFFQKLGAERNGHRCFLYPSENLVPHPMVDPTEVSQGMSNRFWQSLYQETFRFLTTGDISIDNLNSYDQNADLPQVPPVN